MNLNEAYGAMRENPTPIPTPPWVRLGSSILLGATVALLTTRTHFFATLSGAAVCLVAAFVLVFAHPYRREMRSYADRHDADLIPTIAQLVPLMILWLLIMLAPILGLPAWGSALVWVAVSCISFIAFPHVDGTRRLAFV
ncbi:MULTISPECIES: hypothetical protein [Corynebacterium]|jgi:hypothetical protein|uniref:hypothetical protein n=1 Tax=Corynebacterium TaxID=1716 RepID=UPI00019C3DF1|nr:MULTISPECIES: hypothetical protein [Corynebacterium]MCG7242921.1 hypothetical protein [Corynebacterium sp. ACRPS]MCG7272143.1 hypothetical protein [Corynebacterium sp. ACRQM]EEI14437.1 hypothetical protein HMPREF0276_1347 [Corynebacterium accolens ATCC 49725]ERS55298.1 hypothetical protein HMPREF1267_00613 [Corynebacterium sp. KPL1824]MCG7234250.1 hypothetical protein [Corynebacterium sp. ACRPR]